MHAAHDYIRDDSPGIMAGAVHFVAGRKCYLLKRRDICRGDVMEVRGCECP